MLAYDPVGVGPSEVGLGYTELLARAVLGVLVVVTLGVVVSAVLISAGWAISKTDERPWAEKLLGWLFVGSLLASVVAGYLVTWEILLVWVGAWVGAAAGFVVIAITGRMGPLERRSNPFRR